MTEEQVKRISELYKSKSELLNDLSILNDVTKEFILGYDNDTMYTYYINPLKCSKLLAKEIKEIVLTKIQLEIDKIDLELSNIKCT